MPLDEIVVQTLNLARERDLVEVTGGEPLLQDEVYPLMSRVCDAGRTVLLETSGAISIERVDRRVHVILDVKTPGSGEAGANLWSNLDLLKTTDEVKFVVSGRDDFDWSVDRIVEHQLSSKCSLLVSAVHGSLLPTDLAAWVLESGLPLRLQVQLHKILWGAQTRGV